MQILFRYYRLQHYLFHGNDLNITLKYNVKYTLWMACEENLETFWDLCFITFYREIYGNLSATGFSKNFLFCFSNVHFYGVIHKWRDAILDNFWLPPTISHFIVLGLIYCCQKTLETLHLSPWRHLWTISLLENRIALMPLRIGWWHLNEINIRQERQVVKMLRLNVW